MSEVSSSVLNGLEQVEERLAEPAPVCVALLVIEPRSTAEGTPWMPAPALVEAVSTRLQNTLRPYDELRLLADGRFVITLPTLAAAETLQRRMAHVFDVVAAPYLLAGTELHVRALLGAAIRTPGEEPREFLSRVVAAVEAARDVDGRSPVLV